MLISIDFGELENSNKNSRKIIEFGKFNEKSKKSLHSIVEVYATCLSQIKIVKIKKSV